MNEERRIIERTPAKFEVGFVHTGDYLISQSRDISVDGMFLHTNTPPEKGTRTQLQFKLSAENHLQIEAIVVWANASQTSKDKGMAVQFVNITDIEKESILAYIRKIAVLEDDSAV